MSSTTNDGKPITTTTSDPDTLTSRCHCSRITMTFPRPKEALNACQCSLCYRYGAMWAYYRRSEVTINHSEDDTEDYLWGHKTSYFRRCKHCGSVMYWIPLDAQRDKLGVNVRMAGAEGTKGLDVRESPGPE